MGINCSCQKKTIIYTHLPGNPEKSKHKAKRKAILPKNLLTDHYREAASAIISNKAKTPEDIEIICKTLRGHFIFKNLDLYNQTAIINHVKHFSMGPKELIFAENDPGVNFFCIAKGRVEVLCNGERIVLGPGSGFGELALLDDRPRRATIKTIDQCSLWGLDRETFNSALTKLSQSNYEENKTFLNTIPILNPLTSDQKELILSALITQMWNCGQNIIKEGEIGDMLYIIKEGYVICYENKIEKRLLTKGDYFGEQALLHGIKRTATIVAGSDVKLVSICRDSLKRALGDKLEHILYMNSQMIAIGNSFTLKSLNTFQVQSLLNCSKILKFKAGESVVSRGSCKCEKLIIVLKGTIRGPTCDIGIHTCIGDKEITYKDGSVYTVDYIAITDTDVAEIVISEFEMKIGGEINKVTINNEAVAVLTKVQLLKGLSAEKVRCLTDALKLNIYCNADIIVQQDNPGDSFYIIKSGTVKIFQNNNYIRDITIHDYFGERAVIFNDFRTATVIATGVVECWVLHKNDFCNIINESIRKQLLKRIELQDYSVDLNELVPIKTLGTGNFGNVILVSHTEKHNIFALKSISRQKIHNLGIYDNLVLERKIMMQIDHNMIVKLIRTFKDWNRVYFLMEHVKGQDLFEVLLSMDVVREESAKFYMASILMIIEYLHERNIIHRDIKPENIMIDEEGYPKIIDFGTAKVVAGRTYTTVGTPHYMAPEIILKNGYSSSVDLWSAGIVMYEIIFGKVPFGSDEEDPKTVYEEIIEFNLDLKANPYPGGNYKNLIEQLLSVNPAARLGGSMEKLKSHVWFNNFNWNRLVSRQLKPPFVSKKKDSRIDDLTGKTVQEYILDLEGKQNTFVRKQSIFESEEWDADF